jgi:ApeA N-terminal domain 1
MDSLDVRGYFGLPDQPETRLPGQLVFSTADGGSLSLIGRLAGLGRQPSRLVGEAEGRSYTLEDCLQALSAPVQGKQVLLVQRVIVDAVYDKDEPVTADRVSLELANLTRWVRTAGYADAIRHEGEQATERWTLSSDPIQPLSVSIPGGTLQLQQRRGWTGDGITSRTLTQASWFHIEFDKVLPLPDVVDLASDLQDLVSIGPTERQPSSSSGSGTPTSIGTSRMDDRSVCRLTTSLNGTHGQTSRSVHPMSMTWPSPSLSLAAWTAWPSG